MLVGAMRYIFVILSGLAAVAVVRAEGESGPGSAKSGDTGATDEPLIIFSTPDKVSARTISDLVKNAG